MGKSYKLRRLSEKVKLLSVLMFMTLFTAGNVFADDVTFVFSAAGYANAEELGSKEVNDIISFTTAKNSQSNAPKYYTSGSAARFYYNATNGNSMTVSAAEGYVITGFSMKAVNTYAPQISYSVAENQWNSLTATSNNYAIELTEGVKDLTVNNTGGGSNTQLRITEFTVTYEKEGDVQQPTLATPTFSIPAGTYYTPQMVTLATSDEGANIYYTINNGEEILYNAPFTVSATSTIKAHTKLGEETSANATANYTIIIPTEVENIAAFRALANNTSEIYKITSDITYNYGEYGNIYVQDATAGLLIYDNAGIIQNSYNAGDVISGGIIGKRSLYYNLVEFIPQTNPAEGVAGTENLPIAVTMEEIAANPDAYMSKLITITNCKLSAGSFVTTSTQNLNISQGSQTMQMRNVFRTVSATFEAGQYANITGFLGIYNNTLQIYPRYNEDIEFVNNVLPLACNFETANPFTIVNGNVVNKWYIGKVNGFDSNKMYVSSSNGNTNKYDVNAASVAHAWMPVTLPESDMILSFDYRCAGESGNDFLQVSILDENENIVANTLPTEYIARLSGKADFSHFEVLVPASYAGAKKLVFTWSNNAANGTQTPAVVDNIAMSSTCTAPSNLAVSVNERTATVTWDAPADQNAWIVEYKKAGDNAWIAVEATAKTATLSNLSTETNYDVRVKSNCSGTTSASLSGNFYVPCIALTQGQLDITIGTGTSTTYVPFYSYYKNSWTESIYPASNFESAGYINSISWMPNSTGKHNYTALKIYMGTTSKTEHSSNYDWVQLEDLTLVYENNNGSLGTSETWETYQLQTPFYYNGEDNLVIAVSRAADSYTGLYYKGTSATNGSIYRMSDSDPSYANHPGTSSGTRQSILPNIKIDYLGIVCGDQTCAAVENLTVNDITTNGAEIAWEGNAASYKVSYKAQADADWTVISTTENNVQLTGLTQNADYTVSIVAVCDNAGESNAKTANFKTIATCVAPTNLAATFAAVGNTTISWMPTGAESYEIQYGLAGAQMQSAIVNNASEFTVAGLNQNSQYQVKVRAICGENEYSDWSTLTFTTPAFCSAVSNIVVNNVYNNKNAARVSWNADDETSSWIVEYGETGFTLGEGTQIEVTEKEVLLTGLALSTTYDVYVRGNCEGLFSTWSPVKTFSTQCPAYTITEATPWFEDFEGYTGYGAVGFDNCWEVRASSGNYPTVYANYSYAAYSGNNTMEFKGAENIVVLPEFTNDLNTLQISLWANTTASSQTSAGTLELGIITYGEQLDAMTVVQTIPVTAFNRTGTDAAHANFVAPISLANITPAENQRIYLRYINPNYTTQSINIDDITVSIISDCQAPYSLAASDVTSNSAKISWTAAGEETAWQVQYGVEGFELGEGTIVDADATTLTLTALADGVAYDAYVKAVCSETASSAWVGPVTFNTFPECSFRIEMHDSYGDGWNGGKITVAINGTTQDYTCSGYNTTHNINGIKNVPITFTYTAGSFPDENSFEIYTSDGTIIWSLTTGKDHSGESANYTCDGGDTPAPEVCEYPENLNVTDVNATSATLAWSGDEEAEYVISYKAVLAENWETETVTGTTATLTLTTNTTYEAYVKAACDEENNTSNTVTFFVTSGSACNDIEIGNQASTSGNVPLDYYYNNSYSQQIFTASEVGQSGPISHISFNYQYSSKPTKKNNVKIYLANTDKQSFSSSTDWVTEGLVEVYSGALNCSQGWNEFELNTTFQYDNSKNLLLVVQDNSGAYDGNSYNKFSQTPGHDNCAMYYKNDSYQWSATSTGTRQSNRSDVRFKICPDEYSDVALTGIAQITRSCDMSLTPIKLNVTNNGTSAISSLEAYYVVNGGSPVHETITFEEPIVAGAAKTFAFNTLANLSEIDNTIEAWVEMAGDANFNNNTAQTSVSVIEVSQVPFTETFNYNEIHEGWSVVDANDDDVTFTISGNKVSYTFSDTKAADEMLVSTCINVPAGRYDVSYDYNAANAAYVEKFSVYYGEKNGSIYTFNEQIASHEFSNTEVVRAHNQVEIAEDGVYYFMFKAESEAGNGGFSIDNFTIKNLIDVNIAYAENGTGTPSGNVSVPQGEELTLTIVPNAGYHVNAIYKNQTLVRGENAENAAVEFYTFVPNNNDNITVEFATNKYEINAIVENLYATNYNNNALGATYAPMHETVAYGATHTGIITVSPYYHIESVTVNGLDVTSDLTSTSANSYKLTINPVAEDKNIKVFAGLDKANFKYIVNDGQGTINGTYVVDANTTLPAVFTEDVQGFSSFVSTIVPAEGYHVESIIIDGVEHNIIESYSFENVMGSHTVEVVFAKNHYTIATNSFGNGTVTSGTEFDYDPNFVYVFKAAPATGNHIESVLRNNVALNIANPEALFTDTLKNITSDYNYEVLFGANVYTITAQAGENGYINNAGTMSYNYHTNADYTITANEGYYISSVVVDGTETVYTQEDALTTTTISFNNLNADHTVSATFAAFQYVVTVNAGSNGTITPGTSTYNYNATPTFAITPNDGFGIVEVTVDGVSVGAVSSYTFPAITANHTITALFGAYNYTITAQAGNGGTITPAGVTNMVLNGNQTYNITAATGYHIANVYVDGTSVGAVSSYSFTNVAENHTIYAEFEANTYTIVVNQPANGTISPAGTITVQYGETPSFIITPNAGYNVSQITLNASTQVINNASNVNGIYTYTFPAISSNQTITATMTAKTYTITASAGSNGTISPNGSATVNHGTTKSYTITPAEGYVVDNVVVDGMNMGALTTYTFVNVVANHTINATFKQAECEIPISLYTSYIDSTSAVLNWSHAGAASYDIQYKTVDGTFSSVTGVTGNNYTVYGLTPGTKYLWQVRANCSASNHSDWSNMVSFTTNSSNIVGIDDFEASQIKVYAEHQNVHIMNLSNVKAENVRIYDMFGKLLYQGSINSNHEVIGMNVAAGTYVVSITTEQGICNYKVTLMK